MKKNTYVLIRCVCVMLCFLLLFTGCSNKISDPEYKDVVYKIDIPGSNSSTNDSTDEIDDISLGNNTFEEIKKYSYRKMNGSAMDKDSQFYFNKFF